MQNSPVEPTPPPTDAPREPLGLSGGRTYDLTRVTSHHLNPAYGGVQQQPYTPPVMLPPSEWRNAYASSGGRLSAVDLTPTTPQPAPALPPATPRSIGLAVLSPEPQRQEAPRASEAASDAGTHRTSMVESAHRHSYNYYTLLESKALKFVAYCAGVFPALRITSKNADGQKLNTPSFLRVLYMHHYTPLQTFFAWLDIYSVVTAYYRMAMLFIPTLFETIHRDLLSIHYWCSPRNNFYTNPNYQIFLTDIFPYANSRGRVVRNALLFFFSLFIFPLYVGLYEKGTRNLSAWLSFGPYLFIAFNIFTVFSVCYVCSTKLLDRLRFHWMRFRNVRSDSRLAEVYWVLKHLHHHGNDLDNEEQEELTRLLDLANPQNRRQAYQSLKTAIEKFYYFLYKKNITPSKPKFGWPGLKKIMSNVLALPTLLLFSLFIAINETSAKRISDHSSKRIPHSTRNFLAVLFSIPHVLFYFAALWELPGLFFDFCRFRYNRARPFTVGYGSFQLELSRRAAQRIKVVKTAFETISMLLSSGFYDMYITQMLRTNKLDNLHHRVRTVYRYFPGLYSAGLANLSVLCAFYLVNQVPNQPVVVMQDILMTFFEKGWLDEQRCIELSSIASHQRLVVNEERRRHHEPEPLPPAPCSACCESLTRFVQDKFGISSSDSAEDQPSTIEEQAEPTAPTSDQANPSSFWSRCWTNVVSTTWTNCCKW